MTGSINNQNYTAFMNPLNRPMASAGVSLGHVSGGVDTRAVGMPLTAAMPVNPRFANGADRHYDGQNLYGGMSQVGNPYVSSDDHLLATALKNNLPMFDAFKKEGRLTQASLQDIAKEDPNNSTVSERNIMLAREILNRPRLNESIMEGGEVTHKSLNKAADSLVGNTNPNTQTADPFHTKTDAQVVQAFRGMFDDLRDTSEDYTVFFEKHRYVNKDKLIEMSKNPDFTNENGQVVIDASTGRPQKKYSEQQFYMAKNLVERPGLLASLDSTKANGTNIFGSHNDDGWLKNYSIDRWLENDKEEKGI